MRNAMEPGEVAAIARAPQARASGPWSQNYELLASIRDSVERVIYAVIRVNGGKVDPPDPYPRPGVDRGGVREPDPAALAYLDRLRAQHGRRRPQAGTAPPPDGSAAVLYLDKLRAAHRARQAGTTPPATPGEETR